MIHSNLFNAKDIDPAAFVGDALEGACLQLAGLQRNGRPRWTADGVKMKLIEVAAQGDADADENMQAFLALSGAQGSTALPDAVVDLAAKERITCYALCGQTLVKKTVPASTDHHALRRPDRRPLVAQAVEPACQLGTAGLGGVVVAREALCAVMQASHPRSGRLACGAGVSAGGLTSTEVTFHNLS